MDLFFDHDEVVVHKEKVLEGPCPALLGANDYTVWNAAYEGGQM